MRGIAAGLISFTRTRNAQSCTLEMRRLKKNWESLEMNRGLLLLILVLLLAGCGGSAPSNSANSTAAASPAAPAPSPLKGFDADLQYIKNGQYTYIWVFSRKDGKPQIGRAHV